MELYQLIRIQKYLIKCLATYVTGCFVVLAELPTIIDSFLSIRGLLMPIFSIHIFGYLNKRILNYLLTLGYVHTL